MIYDGRADGMSLMGWKSAGVAQRYISGLPPSHNGEKRKRESRQQAYIHGRERVAHIAGIREAVRRVPTKRPLRRGHVQHSA